MPVTTRTLELVDLNGATDASGAMSLRALAESMFRQRGVFLWTFGLIMLAAVAITLLMPWRYASEMNILVRNARPDYLISPERSNGEILQHEVTEESINSEIEILRSRDVAEAVVDPGFAARPFAAHSEAERKTHEKAVTDFLKRLTVESLRKSNVIHVTYTASSAADATATLNKLLKAFLQKQHEIETSTGASVFFAGEATRYKSELDQAQAQLAAYQVSSAVVSVPTAERTLDGQITALDDAIRTTQVQITESADRVGADRRQLAALPPRMATEQRSVPNTQAVEELTATLNNYENKRTALLTRYQPTDRLVVEVNKQIADTSAALTEARTTNGQESATSNNPVYQQVTSALAGSKTDLAALKGKLNDLDAQRGRLRAQLNGVEGSAVEFNTLESRVAELQADYQLYSQKKNEAQMADAMDQQHLVNVAVAENPTFSARPASPRVLLNLALGAFTALFLALCAVFVAELGRATVAHPRELEALSGLPVLATVPLLPGGLPRLEARSAKRLMESRGQPSSHGASGGESWPAPGAVPARVEAKAVTYAAVEPLDETPSRAGQVAADITSGHAPSAEEQPIRSAVTMPTKMSPASDAEPVQTSSATSSSRTPARSFEKLTAQSLAALPEPPVREPKAYPSAPRRVAGAQKPRIDWVQEVVPPEPVQPTIEVALPDVAEAALVETGEISIPTVSAVPVKTSVPAESIIRLERPPIRSRLSPSQRAQQHRSMPRRSGDAPYVTYTVEPAHPAGQEVKPRKTDPER